MGLDKAETNGWIHDDDEVGDDGESAFSFDDGSISSGCSAHGGDLRL